MNWPTIIVLLVIAALVIVAIRILRMGNGDCSCNNKKSSCSGCSVDCPFRR